MQFFGVWDGSKAGHFLYDRGGSTVWAREALILPCAVDGRYCPPDPREPVDRLALVHTGRVTVLAMWDRTADTRPGSNAAFIERGRLTREQMIERARAQFPAIAERLVALRGVRA